MPDIGFIGAGKVGTALALKLSDKGYRIVAVASRSLSSAQHLAASILYCKPYSTPQEVADVATLVFITTPDDAVSKVQENIDWHPGQFVVHTSGALPTSVLGRAKSKGAFTGGFHPLQTFADATGENLAGSTFALEAEEPLLSYLKEMALALGGNHVVVSSEDRALYHLTGVFASNYVVTLMGLADEIWRSLNLSSSGVTSLLPLMKGTVENLAHVGLPHALTGPIARGDVGTIQEHLQALEERMPELASIYKELGLKTIPISLGKGVIDEAKAKEMEKILGGKDEKDAEE
jgi:predicted short-subunit dehydrogenase-like oxidoreductase (DUF2520 family)